MKKVTFLLLILCVHLTQAQERVTLGDINALTFFGVDFSTARVYGAAEMPSELIEAFSKINALFQAEAKKYDPAKTFGNKEINTSLLLAEELVARIKSTDLKTDSDDYSLTEEQIARQVQTYDTGDKEGYGAILIAGLLNKGRTQATYDIVVFDISTKEIITTKKVTTKAGGFGLRNFWASSVHKAMKQKMK